MGFDFAVFFSAGVHDAFSPVAWATAGIGALMMLFLRGSGTGVLLIAAPVFIAVLVLLGLMSRLMFFDPLLVVPGLVKHGPWAFLLFGVFFLAVGALFFAEWHSLLSGGSRRFAGFVPTPRVGKAAGALLSLLLAASLGSLSSLWPVSYQVLVQGEMAFTQGRFLYSLGALCLYEFLRQVTVLAVFLLFVLALRKDNAVFLRQRKSLVAIIASAFCFGVGGALVFFFYVASTKPWL